MPTAWDPESPEAREAAATARALFTARITDLDLFEQLMIEYLDGVWLHCPVTEEAVQARARTMTELIVATMAIARVLLETASQAADEDIEATLRRLALALDENKVTY